MGVRVVPFMFAKNRNVTNYKLQTVYKNYTLYAKKTKRLYGIYKKYISKKWLLFYK